MKFKFTHPNPSDNDLVGPKYWKSLDEAADTPEFKEWLHREFPQGASEIEGVDRRHFLKIMAASFSLAGLGLAGCRQPRQHILPYSKQPEQNIPGVPVYYSSSMPTPQGNVPIIVETHQSRPTKIEGNPSYELYGGSTDSAAQASILNLYDPDRSQYHHGKDKKILSSSQIIDLLKEVYASYKASKGKGLAFLAETSSSPSRAKMIDALKAALPEALWVEYEPFNYTNSQTALRKIFKNDSLKFYYNFLNAKRILAFDSDFLNSDPGHIGYSRAFTKRRRIQSSEFVDQMNRLYVAESNYSLTGAMADHRLRIATSHMEAFIASIALKVFETTGTNNSLLSTLKNKVNSKDFDQKWIEECVKDLLEHPKESLVVVGEHLSEEAHLLGFAINEALNALGNTLYLIQNPKNPHAQSIQNLANAINADNVKTLFILGGNPVYNAPGNFDWPRLQASIGQVIRLGYHFDETSKLAHYHIAQSHYLESWADGYTFEGAYVPVQPMILPIFETFSELELLGWLAGKENPQAYEIIHETFKELFPNKNFDEWLALGVSKDFTLAHQAQLPPYDQSLLESLITQKDFSLPSLSANHLEFRFIQSHHLKDGRFANNAWLQECPDPMTKLCWDNAICISPRLAKELEEKTGIQLLAKTSVMNRINQSSVNANNFKIGKEEALIAELNLKDKKIRGPIHILPGLASYTVLLTAGYGRDPEGVGRVGAKTGFSIYPFINSKNNGVLTGGTLNLTHEVYKLANTQEHWSVEGRAILREASANDYQKNPDYVSKMGMESHSPPIYGANKNDPLEKKSTEIPRGGSLYKTPDFKGYQQWGMAIDLNTCTGCNACVIACQSENNIPVVGKDQVLRGREMHWIRLDRYFSDGGESKTNLPEDPQVSFMSMLCQHCELAPCEMVCPVNATVHDESGLNVMAYNRCVGTRYCANNCPYKVRRFNFFDWNKRSIGHFYEGPLGPSGLPELEKMQKNPDVTVRMRGVMEKCTFCVQRIEEAKINQLTQAKDSSNVKVPDGTIKTACQQVCPTESIIFGDVADTDSQVYQLKQNERNYSALGYLNTRPRTTYLAKIRNLNPHMPNASHYPLSRKEYERRYGHQSHHTENNLTANHH